MDVIFAVAYLEGVSPVGVSLRKDLPLAGSPEANLILGYEPSMQSEGSSSDELSDRAVSVT